MFFTIAIRDTGSVTTFHRYTPSDTLLKIDELAARGHRDVLVSDNLGRGLTRPELEALCGLRAR
jgi:hypothetical protein